MALIDEVREALLEILGESDIRFQLKRGNASDWTSTNPVLGDGEPGLEIDTRRQKIGDGVTAWAELDYFAGDGAFIAWCFQNEDGTYTRPNSVVVLFMGTNNPAAVMNDHDLWVQEGTGLLDESGIVLLLQNPASSLYSAVVALAKPSDKLIIPAQEFACSTNTSYSFVGTGVGSKTASVLYTKQVAGANASTYAVCRLPPIPKGVANALLTVNWAVNVAGGAGNVRWTGVYFKPVAGATLDTGGTTIASVSDAVAGLAVLKQTQIGSWAVTPGDELRLNINRLGNNANDTSINDAHMIGIELAWS